MYFLAPVWAGGLNKMKKIMKKEEGVSPVIATILMVAITVVLAATVYIMVAGMGTGGTNKLVMNLSVNPQQSDIDNHKVALNVAMSNPSSVDMSKVTVTVGGKKIASGNVSLMDLDGDGKLSDGDMLVINDPAVTHGALVAISISGYSGNAQKTLP